MCAPHINKARWPSGPRRATQEILVFSFPETWDVFASRKGRGFESHSCHFFIYFFILFVLVFFQAMHAQHFYLFTMAWDRQISLFCKSAILRGQTQNPKVIYGVLFRTTDCQ